MGKICRHIRAQWSEDALRDALRAIQRGLSQREASGRYGIPRRTLRNHIKSEKISRKLGRGSILTAPQENDLVKRILRLADIGYPVTPKIMRHQVYKYVKNNEIKNNFSSETKLAGRGWFRLFLKRHPELSKRKAQNMNPARAQKLNKFIVNDYFKKLGDTLDELGFKDKPERIYNLDEKGCRLTIHHQQVVMARKGVKRLHLVAPEHAENVTVVGCVSASGSVIPPMILFKGKRKKPEYDDNLPAGSLVRMAPKGSMTTDLFVEFIRHLGKYKIAGKILLVFDGAACHLDYAIVDEADKYDITLLCLPSNTTHELQPLDKSVYRSFEAHWDQEVLRFWESNPDRQITKMRFNKIFSVVWSRCMTQENIVNGFRATGLFPYDPSAIPLAAFAPSFPTERPESPHLTQDLVDIQNEDSESDEENTIPLSELKKRLSTRKEHENSFQKFLKTPDLTAKKSTPVRRKALNYKAQVVTKQLFNCSDSKITSVQEAEVQPSCSKNVSAQEAEVQPSCSKNISAQKAEVQPSCSKGFTDSWYCPLCNEESQKDMRCCARCKTWAHEECLGYSPSDDEEYICGSCED